ncbi:MAG: formyltransferase family protein [Ignavibacteriaceae bacterium]
MRIGILSSHFSFPSINYLMMNKLAAGFAVPDLNNPGIRNIKLISETFNTEFNILHRNSLSEDIINWLSKIKADIVYIFSFPYIIPEKILAVPRFGFINFHPSILPAYRGPGPLFWQLKNGENETGITAYKIDKDFDTGPVIHIEKEQINLLDTYGSLSIKLADTLLKSVTKVTTMLNNLESVNLKYFIQDEERSSYFGNPKRKDLIIDWEKQNAVSIYNLVRASNPEYQGIVTFYKNQPVRLLQVSIQQSDSIGEPGIITDSANGINVITTDHKIVSIDIIYANEGYFTAQNFRVLFNVKAGEKFGKNN